MGGMMGIPFQRVMKNGLDQRANPSIALRLKHQCTQ